MKRNISIIIIGIIVAVPLITISQDWGVASVWQTPEDISAQVASVALSVSSPFTNALNGESTVYETGSMDESSNSYWWLDSGGIFYMESGQAKTVQGSLPKNSKWRIAYKRENSEDTDGGYHPQNIFRLVSRNKWHNDRQEVYFMINADQLSNSHNRNESNGLLLFNRYRDGDNLYYTGIRVDGAAVIKKKIAGTYYTLDYQTIMSGKYDRKSNPNLLPKNTWIGVRSEIVTNNSGVVEIRLYTDIGRTGQWKLVATAKDAGKDYGPIINDTTYVGIRTDFMDVAFTDYKVENMGVLEFN